MQIGTFGPHHECLFCLTSSETLALFHAEKALTMAEFPMARQTLRDGGVPADYLVDCCYTQGTTYPSLLSGSMSSHVNNSSG